MHPAIVTMIAAWVFVGIWITTVIYSQRKIHPKALFLLFFTELWERFSYYGMRALLVLYMIKALLYKDSEAFGIYGAYVSLVYATPVLGGLVADKLLGSRSAIMLGAILMAIGHFAMAFENKIFFFVALGFLIIGNGFFKPNISTLVGKLYLEDDPRKDSAFTLFYMGINTGAFLTPLTCGTIGELYGWRYGFGLAGIGMLIGLIIFNIGRLKGYYEDKGLPINPALINKKIVSAFKLKHLIYLGAFASVPLFTLLVYYNNVAKVIFYIKTLGVFTFSIPELILYVTGIGLLLFLLILSLREDKIHKERLWVVLVLFVFTVMFWTFFELAGSAITLFTERNVNRSLFGYEIPTSSFQAVNPFFIILLAPFLSWLWEKYKSASSPFKFAIALMQLGLGFGVLVLGAKFAGPDGLAPLSFLVFAYLLHTTGELCLSPIGLSLVTKLSPPKIVAFVMGVWLMSTSFAGIIGAQISKFTSIETTGGKQPLPTETLAVYSGVFQYIAYISVITGFLLLFLVPLLKKWMNGIQ